MDKIKYAFVLILAMQYYNVNSQNLTDSLGYKQGEWVYEIKLDSLYGNETMIVVAHYEDDTLNGKYIILDTNENLMYSTIYNKGMIEGKAMVYWRSGKLNRILIYNYDSLTSVTIYSRNGKIFKSYSVRNNLKDGILYQYRRNGKIFFICEYSKGVKKGEQIYFGWKGRPRESYVY